jgi:diadenosine tetraphosphatase ApaH/serine/threonine PP2A family protein phosphatase
VQPLNPVRVAALYDVHGNLPALDAVLAEVDADLILVGGDAVAGPWPSETLERLRGLGDCVRFICGNADRELTEPAKAPREGGPPAEVIEWTRSRLSAEQLDFLARLPLTKTLDVGGLGTVLFCHATPRSDEELLTRISSDERWLEALTGVEERVVVCGHTHVQFERRIGDLRLVNAGSVGMPYEREPGAYWAVLGPDVHLRCTESPQVDIAATGWPEEWPAATPEEATEFFEKLSRERA